MNAVINAAPPNWITEKVESPWIAFLEVGLRIAIALLLPQVSSNGLAAVVPYDSAGVVNYFLIGDQKPPAEIHVVAGRAVLGIKEADNVEGVLAKGHIAAGDVLSPLIVHEHTGRITRRLVDTLSH